MTKIAGVVVVYFPDYVKLVFNIDSYIDTLDQLFIVFNSPVSADAVDRLQSKCSKVQLIINNENIGIASALNQAALKALNLGYEWLLTMDQDSYFQSNAFFESFGKSHDSNIAIYSPTPTKASETKTEHSDISEEILCAMTSGNMLNLNIWKTLGGFEEKLFIDDVDNEYCLRAVSNGFKIIEFKNIPLIHELGKDKEVTFLFKKLTVITHPPIRAYYIFRNSFYIFSKYKKVFPEYVKARKVMLFRSFINIILFSEERIKNIRYIICGIKDYCIGSYGCHKDSK
jgi:rhamnosyltransferase